MSGELAIDLVCIMRIRRAGSEFAGKRVWRDALPRTYLRRGKSTALIVGGSVCGGGGRNGFVRSWRATANGLEAVAELHNDLSLFLDELAQTDAREVADIVYLLGNGSGKARMSRGITTRKHLSWTVLYVSSGELTLAEHALAGGRRIKGGAEVRQLNIEANAGAGMGIFEDLHNAPSADAFARQLSDSARRFLWHSAAGVPGTNRERQADGGPSLASPPRLLSCEDDSGQLQRRSVPGSAPVRGNCRCWRTGHRVGIDGMAARRSEQGSGTVFSRVG